MTEHLSRLTLTLEVDAPLERARVATLGPHLHGVLMESIPADYVQTLHTVPVNPYSQYALARSTTSLEWKISTLTNEARQQIVGPINDAAFAGFRLRASGIATQVTSRSLEQNPLSQFARIFYARPETRKFRVEFLTPTAFKQSGEYVFWPDPRLVFQSLAQKYGAIVDGEEPDPGLIAEFGQSVRLSAFRVASAPFAVGAARVPGFTGSATFTVRGVDTFASYIAALLWSARTRPPWVSPSALTDHRSAQAHLAPARQRRCWTRGLPRRRRRPASRSRRHHGVARLAPAASRSRAAGRGAESTRRPNR